MLPAGVDLISAVFTVSTRRLVMTFRGNIVLTGNFTTANLIAYSGSNRYTWSSHVSTVGSVITEQMSTGVADPQAAVLFYRGNPPVVQNPQGLVWPGGNYNMTVI